MEVDIHLSDADFDDIELTDNEERHAFLDVCSTSFGIVEHRCHDSQSYHDWVCFLFLLLQMGFVNLLDTEDFYRKLKNPLFRDNWSFKQDENGRICCIRLEPTSVDQKIPEIIRRLDGLKCLKFTGVNVSSLHLEGISLLPHLRELNMVWVKGTLKTFVDQIPSENPPIHGMFKSLEKLYFLPHKDWDDEHLKTDELQLFLDSFITIDTIQFPDYSIETCGSPSGSPTFPIDAKWKCSLIKNIVGRRMMERNDINANTRTPLSLWPLILERAQQVTDGASAATGIYYLLREGQVLTEPRNFGRDTAPSAPYVNDATLQAHLDFHSTYLQIRAIIDARMLQGESYPY